MAAAAALCALAGCGGGEGPAEPEHTRVPGRTLTVYASLPRHGESARHAAAVAAGQRLALADAGGRAGSYRVRLVELDSSDPRGDGWDPGAVKANAERAAEDETTIAYLGELDFGASAISVPVTNDALILQVSPADGLTSLTRQQPGPSRNGPERYYPEQRRTFVRLVPADLFQAGALIGWARERGARTAAIVHDGSLFGRELAAQAAYTARGDGPRIVLVKEVRADPDRPDPERYFDAARDLAERRPDAVLYTGASVRIGGRVLTTTRRLLPAAALLGSSALAAPGALERSAAPALLVAKAPRPAASYPPAGRRVLRRLARETGAAVPPEAIYGYESMRLVLDALAAAGADARDRLAVVRRALAPRLRRSVLGSYRIGAGGEVSERRFAGYRRDGERLAFERLLDP